MQERPPWSRVGRDPVMTWAVAGQVGTGRRCQWVWPKWVCLRGLAGPGNACRACSTCGDVAPQWLGGLLPTGKKPHRSMECRWMHEKERKRGGEATEGGKRWWRVPQVAGVPVARKPVAQKWPYSRGTAKNGVEPAGRRRRPPPSRRWVSDAAVPRITTIGPNSEKREKRGKRKNTR